MDREILINKEQARQFAYSIFEDISEYVKTHQEEYLEYLKSEESEDK